MDEVEVPTAEDVQEILDQLEEALEANAAQVERDGAASSGADRPPDGA